MKDKEQTASKEVKQNRWQALLAASVLITALGTLVVACGSDGFEYPPVPEKDRGEFLDSQDDRPTQRDDFVRFEDRDGFPDDTDPHGERSSDDDDDFPSEPEDFDWEEDQDHFVEDDPFFPFE